MSCPGTRSTTTTPTPAATSATTTTATTSDTTPTARKPSELIFFSAKLTPFFQAGFKMAKTTQTRTGLSTTTGLRGTGSARRTTSKLVRIPPDKTETFRQQSKIKIVSTILRLGPSLTIRKWTRVRFSGPRWLRECPGPPTVSVGELTHSWRSQQKDIGSKFRGRHRPPESFVQR